MAAPGSPRRPHSEHSISPYTMVSMASGSNRAAAHVGFAVPRRHPPTGTCHRPAGPLAAGPRVFPALRVGCRFEFSRAGRGWSFRWAGRGGSGRWWRPRRGRGWPAPGEWGRCGRGRGWRGRGASSGARPSVRGRRGGRRRRRCGGPGRRRALPRPCGSRKIASVAWAWPRIESELFPDLGLEQHGAGLAALAEHRNLPALAPRQGVAPLQPAELADADAGDVEQLQQHAVTALGGRPRSGGRPRFPRGCAAPGGRDGAAA